MREESVRGCVAGGMAEHCPLVVEGGGPVMGVAVGVALCLGEGAGSDCLVESVGDDSGRGDVSCSELITTRWKCGGKNYLLPHPSF